MPPTAWAPASGRQRGHSRPFRHRHPRRILSYRPTVQPAFLRRPFFPRLVRAARRRIRRRFPPSQAFRQPFSALSGLTATSTTGSGLSYGTIYYWRANAGNAGGASWSGAWSFTTMPVPAPGVPSLVSPTTAANIGTVTAPTLTWNASGVPATYRFRHPFRPCFLPPFLTRAA